MVSILSSQADVSFPAPTLMITLAAQMTDYDDLDIQRIRNEVSSMNVFCYAHPLKALRPLFRKRNIITAVDLRRLKTGDIVRLSGLLIICHTPPTKSGKRVMFLTLEDETGLFDVVVFENIQKRFAKTILTSQVLTIQGRLHRQGVAGKAISVVMTQAFPSLCGPLLNLLSIPALAGQNESPDERRHVETSASDTDHLKM